MTVAYLKGDSLKTYYLKIRSKFLASISNGTKKHEYRLATDDRKQIKIGDTLVLISNISRRDFVRVSVKNVTIYPDWKEALCDNWEQDFKDIYTSLDNALIECNRFYSRDEVRTYGIICFEVTLIQLDYKNASILLDTNVIIKRESANNVSFETASLFKWFDRKNITKYIHPFAKRELERYADDRIKQNMLIKLEAYAELPILDSGIDDYFNSVISKYPQNENGNVDNALLKEVYNANVDLLLTDDTLMLKKAEELYIRDKVLSSTELLKVFETTYPQNIEYKMLSVKLKPIAEVDLNSKFFDTLREDYEGAKFDDWFKKKAFQKESAYVFEDKGGLKGFLYLKVEDADEVDYLKITPNLTPKRRLKVGTFKIQRTGFRLGERFLRIIFDNARKWNVEEIYVTLFENKRDEVKALRKLMMEWGFVHWGYKRNGEEVLVKNIADYQSGKSPKYNYPLIKANAKHYFLPIYPEYHTDLFPDNILSNEDMSLYSENRGHRYAIEKMYLSAAFDIHAEPSDLVLIYRIGERNSYKNYTSVVTGIAIIEDIIKTKTVDERIQICKDKSIFTETQIKSFKNKYPLVVKLLDYTPFRYKVTLKQLRDLEIVDRASGPRPFTIITDEQYNDILKLGMDGE